MIRLIHAVFDGLYDGMHGTKEHRFKYDLNYVDHTEEIEQLRDEIVFYETLVNRNKQIDAILYNMLETEQTEQKKIAILSKLNSNDKATKKALSEIDRLHKMIDEMGD